MVMHHNSLAINQEVPLVNSHSTDRLSFEDARICGAG